MGDIWLNSLRYVRFGAIPDSSMLNAPPMLVNIWLHKKYARKIYKLDVVTGALVVETIYATSKELSPLSYRFDDEAVATPEHAMMSWYFL